MNNIIWIIILIVLIAINKYIDNINTKKKIDKLKREDIIDTSINEYPYKSKYLLTKTEYKFFIELKEICTQYNYIICPKVRLEDFIDVKNKEQNYKYRGYIKSRHIDFLICDNNLHILKAIELDDYTHNTNKAKKTDDFKNKLFETIGIKLYRINVKNASYKDDITNIFL